MVVRLLFILTLFNLVAFAGARILLTLYALELGAQAFAVGVLNASFSLLGLVLSVSTGKFSDRFGSRALLIYASLGGGVGLLVPGFWPGLPAVFVAATIVGLSFSTFAVLLQTLVGVVSTAEDRNRNFTNYTLIGSIGSFLGPMLAGFSIDLSGHQVACVIFALLMALPAPILAVRGALLPRGIPRVEKSRGSARTLLAEPGLRTVLIVNSLQNAGKDLFQFYMPIYTHSIGLSASAIGVIMACNAAAFFAVRTVLTRLIDRFSEEKVLACAFFVGAASLMLIPFFGHPAMLGAISFLFGLGMGCAAPVVMILMFGGSPKGRSGEAMGLRMMVTNLTRLIGPVLFGSIATVFGMLTMFWLNAAMLGAGGVLTRSSEKAKSTQE